MQKMICYVTYHPFISADSIDKPRYNVCKFCVATDIFKICNLFKVIFFKMKFYWLIVGYLYISCGFIATTNKSCETWYGEGA